MAQSAPKRRKTKAERKEAVIPVRCTREQKAVLTAKAKQLGLGASTWLLSLGLAACRESGE